MEEDFLSKSNNITILRLKSKNNSIFEPNNQSKKIISNNLFSNQINTPKMENRKVWGKL